MTTPVTTGNTKVRVQVYDETLSQVSPLENLDKIPRKRKVKRRDMIKKKNTLFVNEVTSGKGFHTKDQREIYESENDEKFYIFRSIIVSLGTRSCVKDNTESSWVN